MLCGVDARDEVARRREEMVRVQLRGRGIRDEGVFLVTSGIFSQRPPAGTCALAMVNGGLESFVRAASKDLPRRIRLNAVSPPLIIETAVAHGLPQGKLSARGAAVQYIARRVKSEGA